MLLGEAESREVASLEPGDHQLRIFDIRRRVGLVLRRQTEPPREHDPRWLATPLT